MTLSESSTTRLIPLTRGMFATVDAADYDTLNMHKWHAQSGGSARTFYAKYTTARPRANVFMHRLVLGLSRGDGDVDHVDGNGLNNTRGNLRLATRSQNVGNQALSSRNTSGYKGVWFRRGRDTWAAEIRVANRKHYLGSFRTAAEAAHAYDAAAVKLQGDFARPNFTPPGPF